MLMCDRDQTNIVINSQLKLNKYFVLKRKDKVEEKKEKVEEKDPILNWHWVQAREALRADKLPWDISRHFPGSLRQPPAPLRPL